MRITRVLVTVNNFKDNLKRLFYYAKTNLDRAPCTPTLDSCSAADSTATVMLLRRRIIVEERDVPNIPASLICFVFRPRRRSGDAFVAGDRLKKAS